MRGESPPTLFCVSPITFTLHTPPQPARRSILASSGASRRRRQQCAHTLLHAPLLNPPPLPCTRCRVTLLAVFLLDEDTFELRCAMCEGSPAEHSCCFDTLIQYMLLDWVNFATIGVSTYAVKPLEKTASGLRTFGLPYQTLYHNCFDSRMHATHWRALPLYLPMIDLLESKSWHESQALHFYISAGCIPGASVVLGGYSWQNPDHAVSWVRGAGATKQEE
jgi:hypothetical protein